MLSLESLQSKYLPFLSCSSSECPSQRTHDPIPISAPATCHCHIGTYNRERRGTVRSLMENMSLLNTCTCMCVTHNVLHMHIFHKHPTMYMYITIVSPVALGSQGMSTWYMCTCSGQILISRTVYNYMQLTLDDCEVTWQLMPSGISPLR